MVKMIERKESFFSLTMTMTKKKYSFLDFFDEQQGKSMMMMMVCIATIYDN